MTEPAEEPKDCTARYQSATQSLIWCDFKADGHLAHANKKHGARWHDDYVPKPPRET